MRGAGAARVFRSPSISLWDLLKGEFLEVKGRVRNWDRHEVTGAF